MKSTAKNKDKKQKTTSSGAQKLSALLKVRLAAAPVASTISISLIFCLIFNVVAGAFAWQKLIVQERQAQLERFAEHNARVAASNAANFIHGSYKKLEFFQHSTTLISALQDKDPTDMLEVQKALRNGFPKADHIRIFSLNEARVDLDGDPPLRFAEVEIIKQAERREKVLPEAISVGGSKWQINIVVPVSVSENSPVLGTILVTLPISELYQQLRQGVDQVGKVSLFQTFDNKPRLMSSFGNGALFKAERIEVPDSPWQVEFVASKALYNDTNIDFSLLLIVGSLSSLSSVALFAFIGLLIGRSILRKQEALSETYTKMGLHDKKAQGKDALLNVNLLDEDKSLLSGEESESKEKSIADDGESTESEQEPETSSVPQHVFRSYDIRGLAETEITKELSLDIGKALGSEALDQGEKSLIVARDARTHSPIIMENLIRGILSSGCNVINIGTVPTPVLYFATEVLDVCSSGVMVTASHSPAEFNGFKVVIKGKPRTQEDITAVRERIVNNQFRQGIGREDSENIVDRYIDTIFSDVALAGEIRIVVDAGNGVTGNIAPRLFEELGCEVIPLFCDLDGSFPNHGPDPSVEANLRALINKVSDTGAHLGVAFDGDGDRLAVVTPKGEIIWPDRLLMLFAKDILSRNPGADVVFDVKSSRQLVSVVSSHGGRPIMWKTGHAPMRAKVEETGALVGGEFSGHIFIKDRWYGFDDGMYAAARLIEIMSLRDESLDDVFAEFPPLCVTPEYRFAVAEAKKFKLVQTVIDEGEFPGAKLVTLDGLRVEYPYGWGLLRASNTGAEISMRFEAESMQQVHDLKALFTREIRKVDSSLKIHWGGSH